MSTDLLVHRTRVQTRATTNTSQRLSRYRMGKHSRPPVVEQHDMQLVRSFILGPAFRSRDERLVSRQSLPRAGARQKLEKHVEIGKARYDFLDTHQRNVHSWQARGQSNVAFVFDDYDRACSSDREVHAADTNVSSGKTIAQRCTCCTGHLADVVCRRHPELGSE